MSDPLSWVLGRGGLLGRSVEHALSSHGRVWSPDAAFDWSDSGRLRSQLTTACFEFVQQVGTSPWQLVWCAGAGVVSTSPAALAGETQAFRHVLDTVAAALGPFSMDSGGLFLASSAGGVYAGSTGAPYTERSAAQPSAPYGWNKLEQETIARHWGAEHKVPVLIGRIANLYGPGQNLEKGQGLITEVCRRMLMRQPFILYVPLDTIRDYVFASDCGALVADAMLRLRKEASTSPDAPVVVKVFASQRPSSVSTVLAEIRRVTKRPARVVLAGSPSARHQAPDLRMASVVWTELDRRSMTPLSVGVQTVVLDLLSRIERGQRILPPVP